jgi:hypothetical protein
MPQLPQLTGDPSGASFRAPSAPKPGVEAFGEPIGQELFGFGQKLVKIGNAIQDQRDEVDARQLAGQYDVGLSERQARLAEEEPDFLKHPAKLREASGKLLGELDKLPVSAQVKTALRGHAARALPRAIIDVQAAGIKRQGLQVLATTKTEIDRVIELAATAESPLEERSLLDTANGMAFRLEQRGLVSPEERRAMGESNQDRFWQLVATKDPDRMLAQFASGETPAGMDPQKMPHYVNLAVGTRTAQQFRDEQARKAQDAAIKAASEANDARLTAEVMNGNVSVLAEVPALVATRKYDPGKARTLRTLAQSMGKEADPSKYQSGLAAQIEGNLMASKYDGQPLDEGLSQALVDVFVAGNIAKDEFTHLMGKYSDVRSYKMQTGKEDETKSVTQAHSVLMRELTISGPMDKYNPIESQTKAAAEDYFYKRVNAGVNPWDVKKEAMTLFKPVVAGRQPMETADKERFEDATLDAAAQTGGMSRAAAKALRDQRTTEREQRAIKERLANLPKPEPPGWLERMGLTKKAEPGKTEKRKP